MRTALFHVFLLVSCLVLIPVFSSLSLVSLVCLIVFTCCPCVFPLLNPAVSCSLIAPPCIQSCLFLCFLVDSLFVFPVSLRVSHGQSFGKCFFLVLSFSFKSCFLSSAFVIKLTFVYRPLPFLQSAFGSYLFPQSVTVILTYLIQSFVNIIRFKSICLQSYKVKHRFAVRYLCTHNVANKWRKSSAIQTKVSSKELYNMLHNELSDRIKLLINPESAVTLL